MASQITCFDIGEMSIKLAHFSNGELKKTVTEDLPDSLISGGQILSNDAFVQYINALAKSNGLPKKNAALILHPNQVYVRNAKVPIMNESQLRYNLPFEFKDYLTADKSKYVFDYEVLSPELDEDGNAKELRLFACAAMKELIDRYVHVFSKAGYNLTSVIPEEYVFSKLSRGTGGADLDDLDPFAIVDLGHKASRIHILHNGEYDSKRVIEIGMRDVEEIVADVTYSDIHMAHSYVRLNHENVLNDARCIELYNKIAVEILKSINFYNYNNRTQELKDIFLVGGGAAVETLAETIRQVTGLEVHSASELLGSRFNINEPWLFIRAIGCGVKE